MPKFLEEKLKKQYGEKSDVPYKIMNAMGAMRGSKETAKGAAMEKKHEVNIKSYKKGGLVEEDGPAMLHSGEVVLPSRKMTPPTSDDLAMSNDHLHDSVGFNMSHAVQHLGRAKLAEAALRKRGITPRTGSVRDTIDSAMQEGTPLEEATETRAEAASEGDPVAERKARGRAAASAAVDDLAKGKLPSNFTKGAAASRRVKR